MKLVVYALCGNEEHMLPWFLRYYKAAGADKIVIYLNKTSVDGSRAILEADPLVELHEYDTGGVLRDDIHRNMKNEIWRANKKRWHRDDWVIVVDCDEFVASADGTPLKDTLTKLTIEGVTVPLTHGWNIIGDELPEDDGSSSILEVRPFGISTEASRAKKFGKHDYCHGPYHKPCLFRPALIKKMNYVAGAHFAKPRGKVVCGKDQRIWLLHAKWAFGVEYVLNRPFNLSKENHKHSWGVSFLDSTFINDYYNWARKHRKKLFASTEESSTISSTPAAAAETEAQEENEYRFSQDWFSNRIAQWDVWLDPYKAFDAEDRKLIAEGRAKGRIKRAKISRGLEIGVFEGRSSVWLLENILTGYESRLFAIDTFEGAEDQIAAGIDCSKMQETYEYNIRKFKDKVRIFPEPSCTALPKITGTFDFVYIDGSHLAADVFLDAALTWNLLKVGGTMIFDDYAWRQAELPQECPYPAIDAFLFCFQDRYDRLPVDLLPCPDLQVAIRKTHE